jgi:hypothetical protein
MHTLRLNIQDNVFEKVIYFLRNLPKNEVEIIEDKVIDREVDFIEHFSSNPKKLNSVSLKTKGFKFNREEANAR